MGKDKIHLKNGIYDLRKIASQIDIVDLIQNITLEKNLSHDPFYIVDLDEIYNRHLLWKNNFPRVQPYFAVKSNYDPYIIKILMNLGVNFDCSSIGEIKRVLKLNASSDTILFANPVKQISHIQYAKSVNVNKLVFDNQYELDKIKAYHPECEVLLRIKAEPLSEKFGADIETSKTLIKKCIDLNMNLTGISFYVGFRQKHPNYIIQSIKNARILFDYAKDNFNYVMNVLDIGGGFPGTSQTVSLFEYMAIKINEILDIYFPIDIFNKICHDSNKKFKIISELGTFYTCSSTFLCVNVISKRNIPINEEEKNKILKDEKVLIDGKNDCSINSKLTNYDIDTSHKFIYYINDSAHGSFRWYTLQESVPIFSNKSKCQKRLFYSSFAGATCDSSDFIIKNIFMPEFEIGDFLIFKNMGSYTQTASIAFNDIILPKPYYVSSKWYDIIQNIFSNFSHGDDDDDLIVYNPIEYSDSSEKEYLSPKDVLNNLLNK